MLKRPEKAAWSHSIRERMESSSALFLANYKGMTVQELGDFRGALREVGARFHVVKNTVAKKAVGGREEEAVSAWFKGQIGIVYAGTDPVAAAKVVTESAKKNEKLEVLGGYMEGAPLSSQSVASLASLPSREVLLGQILGLLQSPHRGVLGVVQALPRNIVQVIAAIKDKKEAV